MPATEIEKKLAAYRARKEREMLINQYKAEVKSTFSKYFKKKSEEPDINREEIKDSLIKKDDVTHIPDSNSDLDPQDDQLPGTLEENRQLTPYDYVYYVLWFILWLTVYAIFIKLQFGIIYLILSGIIGMYLNTRTGPKTKNEISAYSVFNRNCESIDGTLKAEQLTRELMYGGLR